MGKTIQTLNGSLKSSLGYAAAGHSHTLASLGALGAKTANGYEGMVTTGGSDSSWIRTTSSGIIPYQSGGASALGTSSWPFNSVYAKTLYGALSGNASTATKLATARTITVGNKSNSFDGSGNIAFTLADIGAVAKSGDTMSGSITFANDHGIAVNDNNGTQRYIAFIDTGNATILGNPNTKLTIRASETPNVLVGSTWYKMYHTGNKPTLSDLGAAAASHGTHVTYSTTAPKVAGTAAVGSESKVARGDHVHPLQTSVSGNAGTATKLATARNITIGNKTNSFDGSANISYTLADIGALSTAGGTVTGDINIKNNRDIRSIAPDTTGGWANGYTFRDKDNTKTLGGFGLYGAGTAVNNLYMGYGESPWSSSIGVFVNSDAVTIKGFKMGTARTLTIGSTGKSFDGSANVSWSLSEIGAAASSHTHTTINGVYTSNGGAQPPSYVGGGTVRFNMMNKFKGLSGLPTYADCILMDTYTGSDVPYVTGFGILKQSGDPRAFIAVGGKGNTTTWGKETELLTVANYKTHVTPSNIGAAASSHGTHVTWSTTAPKAAGTAAVGSETKVARGDHVHAAQTSVSGNAGTATKLASARTLTIGSTGKTFDGSANVSWSLSEIGAAASSHTHSYLPLSGGTTTGGIKRSSFPGTWVAAAKDSNAIINSTASAGGFAPFFSGKTTNGSIVLACYQTGIQGAYLTKANVDANTNTVTKNVTLMNESGGASWPGTVSANSFTENGTALSSKYATTTTTGSLSSLKTSAKGSLVAAINEVFQSGSDAKTKLVNALTAKGISASTSDSWDTLIGKLSNIAAAEGANNIYAATSLPATGNTNDICIVSSPLPNHIHIGRIKPSAVDANDIWLDTDGTNLDRPYRVVTVGKLSTNLRVSSAYRLTASGGYAAQVVAYYWDGSKWVVCCPVITTLKSTNSNSTGSISLGSNSRYDIAQSGTCSVTMKVMEGIQYTGKCTVRVYHRYNYGNSGNTLTYTLTAYNKNGSVVTNVAKRTTLGNEDYTYFHDVNVPDPGGYIQVAALTAGSSPANDEYNLYISVGGNKA